MLEPKKPEDGGPIEGGVKAPADGGKQPDKAETDKSKEQSEK